MSSKEFIEGSDYYFMGSDSKGRGYYVSNASRISTSVAVPSLKT